jgi:hypothetical protein
MRQIQGALFSLLVVTGSPALIPPASAQQGVQTYHVCPVSVKELKLAMPSRENGQNLPELSGALFRLGEVCVGAAKEMLNLAIDAAEFQSAHVIIPGTSRARCFQTIEDLSAEEVSEHPAASVGVGTARMVTEFAVDFFIFGPVQLIKDGARRYVTAKTSEERGRAGGDMLAGGFALYAFAKGATSFVRGTVAETGALITSAASQFPSPLLMGTDGFAYATAISGEGTSCAAMTMPGPFSIPYFFAASDGQDSFERSKRAGHAENVEGIREYVQRHGNLSRYDITIETDGTTAILKNVEISKMDANGNLYVVPASKQPFLIAAKRVKKVTVNVEVNPGHRVGISDYQGSVPTTGRKVPISYDDYDSPHWSGGHDNAIGILEGDGN